MIGQINLAMFKPISLGVIWAMKETVKDNVPFLVTGYAFILSEFTAYK